MSNKEKDKREPYSKEELEDEANKKYILLDPRDYPNDPKDPRDISMGDIPARFKHTYKDPNEVFVPEYDDDDDNDDDDDSEDIATPKSSNFLEGKPYYDTFNEEKNVAIKSWMMDAEKRKWKFDEVGILAGLYSYIRRTYDQHYGRQSKNQIYEQIVADGRGVDFCVGTIMKYCSRLDKKEGQAKNDVMKIMHYAVLLKYAHDLENKDE